jgi:hypothetical protein
MPDTKKSNLSDLSGVPITRVRDDVFWQIN